MNFQWFGFSSPLWWVSWPWKKHGRLSIRLFTCFRRQSRELNDWGIGLLSIDGRHLFYVGDSGIRVFFIKIVKWGVK